MRTLFVSYRLTDLDRSLRLYTTLGYGVLGRVEYQHEARPELVRALRGNQGLARAGRHHDLSTRPALRDSTGHKHLKGQPARHRQPHAGEGGASS